MHKDRPTLCLSDLHAGCGDVRDNYAAKGVASVDAILDWASCRQANVIICGDLLELWQCNVSQCIQHNLALLDRLADLNAVYVLGNHDADLLYWCGADILRHKLFRKMVPQFTVPIGGRRFLFIHGHQADPACKSPKPGIGRISAIYTGMWEDRAGRPNLRKCSVEDAVLGPWERLASLGARLIGRPSRRTRLHRGLRAFAKDVDAVVFGHTHLAGELHGDGDSLAWAYNCGCPNSTPPSFVWIEPDGLASVYDWIAGVPILNERVLAW